MDNEYMLASIYIMGQGKEIKNMDIVKNEIGKLGKVNEIMEIIQSNRGLLAEFKIEIKIFQKGKELKAP